MKRAQKRHGVLLVVDIGVIYRDSDIKGRTI